LQPGFAAPFLGYGEGPTQKLCVLYLTNKWLLNVVKVRKGNYFAGTFIPERKQKSKTVYGEMEVTLNAVFT
jgi:hypothetical protein